MQGGNELLFKIVILLFLKIEISEYYCHNMAIYGHNTIPEFQLQFDADFNRWFYQQISRQT